MSQIDLVHPMVSSFRKPASAHLMIIRCSVVISATDDNLLAEQSMLLRDGLIDRFGQPERCAAIELCGFFEREYRQIAQTLNKGQGEPADHYWARMRAAIALREKLEKTS